MRLDELTIGRVGPTVSTIDRSAPWVKAGIDRAGKITQEINTANTPKEKFDVIRKIISGGSAIKIRIVIGNNSFSENSIKSYDISTGSIMLVSGKKTAKCDVNDFTYTGRTRSSIGSPFTYTFTSTSDSDDDTAPVNKSRNLPGYAGKTGNISTTGLTGSTVLPQDEYTYGDFIIKTIPGTLHGTLLVYKDNELLYRWNTNGPTANVADLRHARSSLQSIVYNARKNK